MYRYAQRNSGYGNGKITDLEIADKEAVELSEVIQNWKEKYFHDLSLKLNDPQTTPETYWLIIKSCYNGRIIPIIHYSISKWKNC